MLRVVISSSAIFCYSVRSRETPNPKRGKLGSAPGARFAAGIVGIAKGGNTPLVQIGVGSVALTASIASEAMDDLKLAKGEHAYAVIKASDVMVGVD